MPEPHTILWMLSIFGHSLVDPAPHDLCHSLDACMCKSICLLHVILLCRKFCLGHRHCPPLTYLFGTQNHIQQSRTIPFLHRLSLLCLMSPSIPLSHFGRQGLTPARTHYLWNCFLAPHPLICAYLYIYPGYIKSSSSNLTTTVQFCAL